MKRILGLDLGTNSIGWALTQQDFNNKKGQIDGIGSRIIPMSQDVLGKFDAGVAQSQTAERTKSRSVRRLYQRDNLRRERLHRVLNILGFLPKHYAEAIDFEQKLGQFKDGQEIKLNYLPKKRPEKHEFIFVQSFLEMVREFEASGHTGNIPYDWTLYYLRKKSLKAAISKEELAWVILNFNQKRGYYQLRGEDDEVEDNSKLEEFHSLKVISVEATDQSNDKGTWYNVHLENGWIYRRQSKEALDGWIGKTKEFIVTTQLGQDGQAALGKDGEVKRSFRAPKEDDWKLMKKKTEHVLELFNRDRGTKGVALYIYENLLRDSTQKIRGSLIKTIERKYYREELDAILLEQSKHHPEFKSKDLFDKCVDELYPRNEAHQNTLADKDLHHLILKDIIFYQRPLKSKKSTIANCQYEFREHTDKDGIMRKYAPKGIPRSHPLFQEFRLWQFIKNLKIYQKEGIEGSKTKLDLDVTASIFTTEDAWVELFDFLSTKKEVEQKHIITYLTDKKLIVKADKDNYRWNYVVDKPYPCGDTRAQFLSRLSKVIGVDSTNFLTPSVELHLWHLIYSVKDKFEFEKALPTFARRYNIDEASFIDAFKKFPPFKNEYGSYSEKAIKKLLPLMRMGAHWNEADVLPEAKERVAAIIERLKTIGFNVVKIDENVADDDVPKQLLKSFIDFKDRNPLKGLNTYQACYAVYARHSEASSVVKWNSPQDIDRFLFEFKQHSLRNPIVEQVVVETLRVVRDIWVHHGKGEANFFDEIHIELGREMKNPADKRKAMTEQNTANEATNIRIRELLKELMNDGETKGDVRPFSPSHQELLKIYEEGVYQSLDKVEEDIEKIRKNSSPTSAEIKRYKLWLEQNYISPYTGKPIPLSRLFTTDYQIEHIIPQSRCFDDSMSNKVICESAVNELKDNSTAYEFIKKQGTSIVQLGQGSTVRLFSLEEYEIHCNRYFKKNRGKLKKLLSEEIPEGFIERQMNDTRYISKLVKSLLSNIVREEGEQEATSKHIVPVTGAITSTLKHDWGLNDKWNALVAPRFQRLNELTNSKDFGDWDPKINAFRTQVPEALAKGFNKKRIDHRHHALDALVIACTTKDHVNYITSLNTERNNRSLVSKLRIQEEIEKVNRQTGEITKRTVAKAYHMPWAGFTAQAEAKLETVVISFKQNLRVINKTTNRYMSYKDEQGNLRIGKDGKPEKGLTKQTKGDSWAIRKSLHKDTVSGKVELQRIKEAPVALNSAIDNWKSIANKRIRPLVKEQFRIFEDDSSKVKAYFKKHPIIIDGIVVDKVLMYETIEATAVRTELTEDFTRKQLESITDTAITIILENHIKNYVEQKGDKTVERFDLAFNPDGLDELNRNMVKLNNGKPHQPIKKVRIYEEGGKFSVGVSGNKSSKYVEAAKGTNLFFAIYWNEKKGKREYDTIPLNEVVEHQKQVAHLPLNQRAPVPIDSSKGTFLFSLSPNDLVYVPTYEEGVNVLSVDFKNLTKEQASRVYKMVSTTQGKLDCVPHAYSSPIRPNEIGSNNKSQNMIDNVSQIKDRCWKLEVDKLGNITQVIR